MFATNDTSPTVSTTVNPAMSARHQFATLLAFNTLIAVGISAFGENRFVINLVYSHCIGLCIWTLLQLQMLLFIRQRQTQWPRLVWAVPIATTGGYLLGTVLGQYTLLAYGIYTAPYPPHKTLGYLVLSLAAGAAITYYFLSRERLAHERQRTEAARLQASEARLRLLESQLEPHMLFNTLSNLRVLIGTDPARAQTMLDHMTAYLRATLSASQVSTHTLATEFERLHDYLELISIRMGARLRFELMLPPDLAALPVPALLLQPLVENSIQHGLEPSVAGGHLWIRAERAGATLRLQVHDNGTGITLPLNSTGFGLQQVRERLLTLFGTHAQLFFEQPAGGGTLACITLPLAP